MRGASFDRKRHRSLSVVLSFLALSTYLVNLNHDQEVVILQINLMRLTDQASDQVDDRISLHDIVIPHIRPDSKLH